MLTTPSFLQLAQTLARASKDPHTQVGAIIADSLQNIRAVGYNGFPRGVRELGDRWARPAKYLFTVHAEVNAIYSAARTGTPLNNCFCYVTLPPCLTCAGALIQAGITRVYYPAKSLANLSTQYKDNFPLVKMVFDEAGVEVEEI